MIDERKSVQMRAHGVKLRRAQLERVHARPPGVSKAKWNERLDAAARMAGRITKALRCDRAIVLYPKPRSVSEAEWRSRMGVVAKIEEIKERLCRLHERAIDQALRRWNIKSQYLGAALRRVIRDFDTETVDLLSEKLQIAESSKRGTVERGAVWAHFPINRRSGVVGYLGIVLNPGVRILLVLNEAKISRQAQMVTDRQLRSHFSSTLKYLRDPKSIQQLRGGGEPKGIRKL